MSIKYCDFLNGDDDTGNGSAGNPYKTIDKASESLTGGDEVRVAKSPDDTVLTGTVTFTKGSVDVVGDGTLFTSELAAGDFLVGTDGFWYEVASISDDETLTITYGYLTENNDEDTISNISFIDTADVGQLISSSGVSISNRLKISGGWNLTTETQTGKTVFVCTDGEPTGLNVNGKNYLEIDKLSFLKYNNGINCLTGTNRLIKNGVFNYSAEGVLNLQDGDICEDIQVHAGAYEILIAISGKVIIRNNSIIGLVGFHVNDNADYKLTVENSKFYFTVFEGDTDTAGRYTFDNCEFNNTYTDIGGAGDNIGSREVIIQNSEFNFGMIDGILCDSLYFSNVIFNNFNQEFSGPPSEIDIISNRIRLEDIVINNTIVNENGGFNITCSGSLIINNLEINNVTTALTITGLADVIINKFITSGVTNDIVLDTLNYNMLAENPVIGISHYQTAGVNKCYFMSGTSQSNTSEARSGKCLQMIPTSAEYYIAHKFYFRASNGVGTILGLYIKKDASFNGDVKADVRFVGEKIVDNQTITPSTNDTYELKNITIDSGDITEDGVLELIIKVRGTSGNIYLDDFSRS
jgi:hypothetical protein